MANWPDRARVDVASMPPVVVAGPVDARVVEWFGSPAPTVGPKGSADSIPVVVTPDQLDVAISTRASETSVASILARLDVALSTRAGEATVAAILADAAAILSQLDVALSSRASQVTAAAILSQLDVALSSRASQVTAAAILSQLDVALSSRAADATLAAVSAKIMPTSASRHAPARASNANVKASAGTLWTIYANNNTNADVWLMTFDAAALPANGTAPADFIQIPRNDNGEMGIFVPGSYSTGIHWAASTTDDTLTLAGNVLLVRARFT